MVVTAALTMTVTVSNRWCCCLAGSCVDKVNDFKCFCAPGYTGRMCNEEINECASNPCKNGGTCQDLINAYECHCPPDREGRHCEYELGKAPLTTKRTPPLSTFGPKSASIANQRQNSAKVAASRKDDESNDDDDMNVEFTREQLLLVICFGSGVPMCHL